MRPGLPNIAELEAPLQASALVKERVVPNFERSAYKAARITIPATDGTPIPVSLLWRPDALKGAQRTSAARSDFVPLVLPPSMKRSKDVLPHLAPVYLEGYGSYGVANDVYFSANLSALADQGVVVATAHIRGGGECGRAWYEREGKFLTKANTFTDFIDVAQGLTDQHIAAPKKIVAYGASAGGLLIGNAINRAPELWAGAVGDVPFVDLMTTMCDPSIHLTTEEWLEWGNPNLEVGSGACFASCGRKLLSPCILPLLCRHSTST
jgi:oligopeptidase B